MILPENVKYIIGKLNAAGFEAYSVGGCVRDSLIGRIPGDWDITTSALPAEIKNVFRHTVDTGIEHGTVTVLIYPDTLQKEGFVSGDREQPGTAAAEKRPDGKPETYEVTTYRIDGAYKDGRHPEQVTFTSSLREDLRRRDFTINAMAYNDGTGLVDLFDGTGDLNRRMIRCVGNADERFDEDALRILRAVRFAAQLDFEIAPDTAAAVTRHAARLGAVSRERVFTELNKLLCSAHMERLSDLFQLGLAEYIADGFPGVRCAAPGTEAPAIPQEKKYLRYALICRGWKEDRVRDLLRALKSDLDTVRHASYMAARLLVPIPAEPYALKKRIAETDPGHFRELLLLKKSIAATAEYAEACGEEDADRLIALFDAIMDKGEPVYMKDLVVTGDDLKHAGVPAGPGMGELLARMLDDVRREPVHNSVLYLFNKYLGQREGAGLRRAAEAAGACGEDGAPCGKR